MSATIQAPALVRYRRHPRPFKDSNGHTHSGLSEGAREKTCDRTTGHVLVINEKGITCTACGAEWHDYHH